MPLATRQLSTKIQILHRDRISKRYRNYLIRTDTTLPLIPGASSALLLELCKAAKPLAMAYRMSHANSPQQAHNAKFMAADYLAATFRKNISPPV
jgi:hypothetical protein